MWIFGEQVVFGSLLFKWEMIEISGLGFVSFYWKEWDIDLVDCKKGSHLLDTNTTSNKDRILDVFTVHPSRWPGKAPAYSDAQLFA